MLFKSKAANEKDRLLAHVLACVEGVLFDEDRHKDVKGGLTITLSYGPDDTLYTEMVNAEGTRIFYAESIR